MAVTRNDVLPMPNDQHDDKIVIASCWLNDDEGTYVTLELRKAPPFYIVYEWENGRMVSFAKYPNIVHASECYLEMTGCV